MLILQLGNADGVVTARVHNDAVHTDLLNQIHGWITAGAKQDDVIERLRLKTVPTGYNVHTWIQGMYILKSICLKWYLLLQVKMRRK